MQDLRHVGYNNKHVLEAVPDAAHQTFRAVVTIIGIEAVWDFRKADLGMASFVGFVGDYEYSLLLKN